MEGFNIEDAEFALEQEEKSEQFNSAINELTEVRKELESLKGECSALCEGLNILNSDFSSKITQLKQANQVNVTQEAKAYIEEQGSAIIKRICNDLEAKSRKIVARMTYQTERVQIPTSACYVLCLSLIILVVGFALLILLNLYRIRNEMLTQFIWIVCGAFVCFNLITIITFAWVRKRD